MSICALVLFAMAVCFNGNQMLKAGFYIYQMHFCFTSICLKQTSKGSSYHQLLPINVVTYEKTFLDRAHVTVSTSCESDLFSKQMRYLIIFPLNPQGR